MSQELLLTLVMTAVVAPVLLFITVALLTSSTSKEADVNEYFMADGNATQGDFVNSSTSYMIQVSTTFYFIYWGYNYGFSNVFYLLSWSAGLFLFSRFSVNLHNIRHRYSSIPAYVAEGRSSIVRAAASVAAILSFAAVFYVEAFFTADLVAGFGRQSEVLQKFTFPWWVTFAIITVVVGMYSALGGMKKVIATDTWQLSLAYVGFSFVFAYLLSLSFSNSQSSAWVMSILSVIIYLAFLLTDRNLKDGKVKLFSILASLLILGIGITHGAIARTSSEVDFLIAGAFRQVTEPWGWFTLAGFVILNSLWQFADSSNFQRINSVSVDEDVHVGSLQLRKLLLRLAVVSPLTWGLGIILGMLIKTAGVSVSGVGLEYQSLVAFLQSSALSGEIFAIVAIFLLVAGLVAIMMSTCDSAINAAALSYSTDIKKEGKFTSKVAIAFAGALVVLVFAIALLHQSRGSETSILTVMAGAYSAIIVLAPLTIARLFGFRVRKIFALLAIGLGTIAAFVATFGPIEDLPFNVQLVLPIFVAVGFSVIFTVIGMRREKVRVSA